MKRKVNDIEKMVYVKGRSKGENTIGQSRLKLTTVHLICNCLSQIVIPCFDIKATNERSVFQNTYFTFPATCTSARIRRALFSVFFCLKKKMRKKKKRVP